MGCMNAARRRAKKAKPAQELEGGNKAIENTCLQSSVFLLFRRLSTPEGEENHFQIVDPKDFMDESGVPRGNFAESEASIVQNVVATVCLGLTNSENWALLHRATKTPRSWPTWFTLRGISKHTKTRRRALEEGLISQLQS
ncbi:uncharacterized protein EAF01_011568 [Botrytis porri]|uniref:uncharacterized protein n=1 Tax=Botrytis porri TaxID=87229 RepID=UPI0018FF228D|nr:uncharacterized protein EAF01_011568 [Botrytis porri]KAF7884145.1 hypothetical protein EAF01_011568 [Botrytis porri]